MAETEEAPTAVAAASPKGKKAAPKKTAKKAGTAPSHPPISQMVNAAVKELKEKGGSSTQAIKKYINATYKIDVEKKSKFIAKYLKSAVASGSLVQTKGKGASGSFKLPGSGGDSKPKKPSAKKATTKASTKKATPTKKKTAASKPAAKTEKKVAPSKAKKAKKPPTTPKPPKAKAASKVKKTPAKPKTSVKKKPATAAKKKASPKKK